MRAARERRRPKKTFTVGQVVEFQREAGYSVRWEPGVYSREPSAELRGWHTIAMSLDTPPRRINVMTGMEIPADSDDPHSFITDTIMIPTVRLRAASPEMMVRLRRRSARPPVPDPGPDEVGLEQIQRDAFEGGMLAGKLGKGDEAWIQWRNARRRASRDGAP